MKKIIIIPAYNEQESIVNTVIRVKKNAKSFDYVVINDCSEDKTLDLLKANGMNFVNLPVNLGIGGAVQTGFIYALENEYDIAVQIDGDGQHDPRFLEEMSHYLIKEKADMVIGSRYIEKEGFQSTIARRLGIKFLSGLIKLLTGYKITDPTSGLRMVGKRGIALFAREYPKDYPEPESTVAMIKRGMSVKEIPVVMNERQGGVSSIRFINSVYYMMKVTLAIMVECIRKVEKPIPYKDFEL